MMSGAKLRTDITEPTLGNNREISGFEKNAERVDRAINNLSGCIDNLFYKLNCTLVPSAPVCTGEAPNNQNEPVLSEFEAVMKMFCERIDSLACRVGDVTQRCTL